ncbi:addiction module toxin, RelE/StbE family [Desulfonauticus submarinus]|uniref:Addiction module toxin, RelE/StbE family n=1 Tax=Desulfonauticus submarinus TaxID=206665 RepID=A0A1H0B271_9BACT|nr:type II toxin-antitoxin system mRNA interferase toxin, RelE/StbE family [Desulfonauticus submarinus]SDN39740.1 addiction module toxin, RelE/StbE family [Desulfonauticus submarinus]
MKLIFEKRFEKDLKKIKDKRILEKVKSIIEKISLTGSLLELDENVKRMRSNPNFWRIKIGDYRIGLEKEKDKIIFVRILHRKDIYKYFP